MEGRFELCNSKYKMCEKINRNIRKQQNKLYW